MQLFPFSNKVIWFVVLPLGILFFLSLTYATYFHTPSTEKSVAGFLFVSPTEAGAQIFGQTLIGLTAVDIANGETSLIVPPSAPVIPITSNRFFVPDSGIILATEKATPGSVVLFSLLSQSIVGTLGSFSPLTVFSNAVYAPSGGIYAVEATEINIENPEESQSRTVVFSETEGVIAEFESAPPLAVSPFQNALLLGTESGIQIASLDGTQTPLQGIDSSSPVRGVSVSPEGMLLSVSFLDFDTLIYLIEWENQSVSLIGTVPPSFDRVWLGGAGSFIAYDAEMNQYSYGTVSEEAGVTMKNTSLTVPENVLVRGFKYDAF